MQTSPLSNNPPSCNLKVPNAKYTIDRFSPAAIYIEISVENWELPTIFSESYLDPQDKPYLGAMTEKGTDNFYI